MRTGGRAYSFDDTSLEARCDALLMGKLGHELAGIYHDTLHAPLPAGLKSLIERLEAALDPAGQTAILGRALTDRSSE